MNKYIKKIIKDILGNKIAVILKFALSLYKDKIIVNYYKTKNKKYALLSYIQLPFIEYYFSHTNSFEATSWGKILNELGYQVDIINYNSCIELDLEKYDLICGFGDIFQRYFEDSKLSHKAKTIYYATGMHVCHQNNVSLSRVKDVFDKKHKWLAKSARFVDKTWTHQTTFVDAIVALGNDVCADSYKKYYNGKIYTLNAPFFRTLNATDFIESRHSNAKYNFMWFGSSGLIHKGLDLLLDYFKDHTEINLHICGSIEHEADFVSVYYDELSNKENIIVHGFVDINSDKFSQILKQCAFVIFPTCSEGGCVSILTAIGNGGLIPIVTKEATINTMNQIWIEDFTLENIHLSIEEALRLDYDQIKDLQYKNLNYVLNTNSQDAYYDNLKSALNSITKEEYEL